MKIYEIMNDMARKKVNVSRIFLNSERKGPFCII